jgi:hypothetical protein
VRPVLIMVGLVLAQDLPQMVLIPDEGAVEKLASASAAGWQLCWPEPWTGFSARTTTKYATIWQRDADGRWRLAVDSSSPNPRSVWTSQPTVSR